MPIKLNDRERERLNDELRSYPSYMRPIVEHMLKKWSLGDDWQLTEDKALERKESAIHWHEAEVLGLKGG